MSTPERFALVSWSVEDVLHIRHDWTQDKALDFLAGVERRLTGVMVERGWEFLEAASGAAPVSILIYEVN